MGVRRGTAPVLDPVEDLLRAPEKLRAEDLPTIARLFEHGQLSDEDDIDRVARGVLAPMIEHARDRREVAHAIAGWRGATTPAQRRAACLAFVAHVAEYSELAFSICADVVWSPDPTDHLAVAELLAALAAVVPARTEAFVRRHAHLMSRTCVRKAVATLRARDELLAHHRRATTITPKP